MRLRTLCSLLLALALAPALVGAQTPPTTNGNDRVRLDFKDAELTDVIQTIAKLTGKNFLFDERVRGRVTVLSETPVTADEAYRVFEAILQVKGFTTVEGPGGVLKIIPTREAKEAPISTTKGTSKPANRDNYITRLVPLRFIKADAVATTFRPLVSKDANLIAYPPTNTLILSDTSANIRRLLTILAEIDVETYREQIKVIPLEYADAAELVGHLETIFSTNDPASTARTPAARAARRAARVRGQAQQTAQQIGTEAGISGEPRFIADDRTNSIIVLAPRGTLIQVEKLVTLLDYQREGAGRIHVVRLQNADSEEMAQTLASLADGGAAAAGRGGAGAAAVQSAVAELQGGVKVTADGPTNSLIIQANAEGFAAIRDVITALDIRRPQVLVEALIMEVDVDDNEDLGVGWLYNTLFGRKDAAGSFGFDQSAAFSLTDPNNALGQIAGSFVGGIGKTINVGGVQIPVIQALITATAGDQDTNIISAPRLLTADNEEAQIVVGENIPIPVQQIQQPQTSGATAPFQTSNSIERRDVGVTLRVTPQISEGDTVRLDIFQEISEVQANSSNPDLGPDTTNRQVENTVYVRDGEAVMIGGILQENLDESVTKVPFLADVPGLGWAFRRTSERLRKTNLLIILTPHIVRDPEDLERLTIERREEFRNAARGTLELSEEEQAKREAALEAGLDLPLGSNPIRRKLGEHTRAYPTESLPDLRERRADRERERLDEIRGALETSAGTYLVQVSLFRDSAKAVDLLEDLIERGYDGTVLARKDSGEVVHTVQLGPYTRADRAQAVAREVESELGLDAQVVVER